MLKKNVYLLYPAGYHGNYLKWAIEVSDFDSRLNTPLDPINQKESKTFGGQGTSHLNPRVPTHQGFRFHIEWVIRNRPTTPKIYLINSGEGHPLENIMSLQVASFLGQDPNGVVIAIHDGDDPDVKSYGRINCVTKWPTYIPAMLHRRVIHDRFDPFNCSQDRLFRNYILENDFIGTAPPIDLKELDNTIDRYNVWYQVRHGLQPHEVNPETYPEFISRQQRYYSINCSDIPSDRFLEFVDNLLSDTGISDDYDTKHFKSIHQDYVQAQPNLKWFDSIKKWRCTGELDDYLCSHSVIEAEVIRHMLGTNDLTGINWKNCTLPEINSYFQNTTQRS